MSKNLRSLAAGAIAVAMSILACASAERSPPRAAQTISEAGSDTDPMDAGSDVADGDDLDADGFLPRVENVRAGFAHRFDRSRSDATDKIRASLEGIYRMRWIVCLRSMPRAQRTSYHVGVRLEIGTIVEVTVGFGDAGAAPEKVKECIETSLQTAFVAHGATSVLFDVNVPERWSADQGDQ